MSIALVLIGESGVGKTSLFQHLCGAQIRAPIVTCACHVGPLIGKGAVQVWDTPGAVRLSSVMKHALRGASVVLIVCDKASYSQVSIKHWVETAFTYTTTSPGIIVILNKAMLSDATPHCPYKMHMVNTDTGFGVAGLINHLCMVSSTLIDMSVSEGVASPVRRRWCALC